MWMIAKSYVLNNYKTILNPANTIKNIENI